MDSNNAIAYLGFIIVGSLEWIDPFYKLLLSIGIVVTIIVTIRKEIRATRESKNKKNG